MRYSKQRELILRYVQGTFSHPTAEDVYSALKGECPGISLGTVYRNLNGMVERGEIIRVVVPGQADHFDHVVQPHGHFCCSCCGKLEDVPLPDSMTPMMSALLPDHQLDSYAIGFFGLCSTCRNNKGKVS